MNWNDIKKGDTVKVMYGDLEISGEVPQVTDKAIRVGTPGLYFMEDEVSLLEHNPGFRDGDVAIITTPFSDRDWVGVYDSESRKFTTGVGGAGHVIHQIGYSDRHVSSIKVIANVNNDND